MLQKNVSVDLIEVVENGTIQVRTKISIREDGAEISSKFQRHVIAPGADVSNEDDRVRAIASVVHTPAVIAAHLERKGLAA